MQRGCMSILPDCSSVNSFLIWCIVQPAHNKSQLRRGWFFFIEDCNTVFSRKLKVQKVQLLLKNMETSQPGNIMQWGFTNVHPFIEDGYTWCTCESFWWDINRWFDNFDPLQAPEQDTCAPDNFCQKKTKLVGMTHEYTCNSVRSDTSS
jgi:hypothetical protein